MYPSGDIQTAVMGKHLIEDFRQLDVFNNEPAAWK